MTGQFLSTPSARRATFFHRFHRRHGDISIHALREEGDRRYKAKFREVEKFLSTPSARRATNAIFPGSHQRSISIHALREEGDVSGTSLKIAGA